MALELPDIQHQKIDADMAEGTNELKIGSVDSELLGRETGHFDRILASPNASKSKTTKLRVFHQKTSND
jgi:hypothetical protein